MSTRACPNPEVLARFATGGADSEEWRAVVRHLSDCDLCRRQVALVAEEIPADLPLGSEAALPAVRTRSSVWPRVAAVAASVLLVLGVAWSLLRERPSTQEPSIPVARPKAAPTVVPAPVPEKDLPVPVAPPSTPPPTRTADLPLPIDPRPPVVMPKPAPTPESPFLVERTRSLASEAIEIVPEQGSLSRLSAKGAEPLEGKGMIQPSDTLTSRDGGSLRLPDGSTLHLAPEAEVRIAWSQSLACTTVDVRSGDAVVDLGKTPKPLFVAHQAVGVQLLKSSGTLCVSIDQGSLRTTLLNGSAEVQNRSGGSRVLTTHQSLVLRENGDALESVEKPDVSRFLTLNPGVRVPPGPASPRPSPEAKAPPLDVLAAAVATQSYGYRVSGREVRDGVWSPAGIYTSTIENVTAARRADETDTCHFQRGTRPWDELGKLAAGSRDARLVDLLRGLKAPHQMVLDLIPAVSGEGAPRTEKLRDRLCLVWELRMTPQQLRKSVEAALEAAVAEGRLQKPDFVYWDTLEGGLEVAALKFESRLMRVVDRRKVAYSYKTVTGLDRRTWQLETVIEFFSHGVATFPLSAEVIKRLNLGPQ